MNAMGQKKKKRPIRLDEDFFLQLISYSFIALFTCLMVYPLIFVVSASISDPSAVEAGKVVLWPVGFSLEAYKLVFKNSNIWNRFLNSVIIVAATIVGVLFTTLPAAYSLSQRAFKARSKFTVFFTFTMFFSGGMIPGFILTRTLGLYDTRWSVILPAWASAWLLIIAKNYFATIPQSLSEAAKIDGANHFRILTDVYLPTVKPVMAVIALQSGVGAWNSYFSAMLYIPSAKKQPIQLFLAQTILQNTQNEMMDGLLGAVQAGQDYSKLIKYAVIVVTIAPIMCLYPLLQKYLVGGVMIGSIKE